METIYNLNDMQITMLENLIIVWTFGNLSHSEIEVFNQLLYQWMLKFLTSFLLECLTDDFNFSISILSLFISVSRLCWAFRPFWRVLILTASAWIVLAILWSSSLRIFWFDESWAESISTFVISRRISGIVRSIFVSMSAISSSNSNVDFLFDDSKLLTSRLKLKFEFSNFFCLCSTICNLSMMFWFAISVICLCSNRCADSISWTWARNNR